MAELLCWGCQNAQPGRSSVCPSPSIPRLLCSIRAWLLPATCTAPADEEELLPPTSVLLFVCLFKLLQLVEAKPTKSSAAAGFFHYTVVFGYFWQFRPAKAKNPNELSSCSTKTQRCALSQMCTKLSGSWSQHGRNQMAGQQGIAWVSSSKAILFKVQFFPSQPAHLGTCPPGLPLIPLSAHTPRYPGSEQFYLLSCHA